MSRGGRLQGATAARTWTTSALPAHEQFPFWRDVVWEAFVPVSLQRPDEGRFPSTVTASRVGPISVSRISSQAQTVSRTLSQIGRARGDVFFLNLPLTEGATAAQHGRTAQLAPGDLVLVDSTSPFELRFEQPFEQVSLMLPHDLISPRLVAPARATAVRVPGDHGIGAVAGAAIRALANTPDSLDRQSARGVVEHLTGLIALSLGGVQSPSPSTSRAVLLQSALDALERSLGDPDLCPGGVAHQIGVSTRYLHRLFADGGTTFGRTLLNRRLQAAHRDLRDPTRAHWTISAIAIEHGFRDPAYFARAFKTAYGISPREVRRAG